MTTWYTDYIAIWDALVNLVKALNKTDGARVFNEENVFYGEKYPPENYPSCYVCPMPITLTPATFRTFENSYVFDLAVVTINNVTKTGYFELFELVGMITDALVADPTLSGTTCHMEPLQIIPNWRNMGEGVESFWAAIRVKLTRIR
jgi:hypothetical protein